MPLSTFLFLVGFVVMAAGALFEPLLGVIACMAHYVVGADRQWWTEAIKPWGIRYSFTLTLCTALGILLNRHRLRYGKTLLRSQEQLFLLFMAIVWLLTLLAEPTVGDTYAGVDHPSLKMTKVILFALMLTHVVTTVRTVDVIYWVLVVSGLALGLQAYWAPASSFEGGRLEGIGGADFAEANFCSAYLAAMLPIIGFQFLQTRWLGKAVCLVSGVFVANGVVLMRSRGAVVGLAAGAVVALVMAPKRFRLIILAGIIVVAAGGYYLTDPQFLERAGTISAGEEERDTSVATRLEIWNASLSMWESNPLGVGPGNYFQTVGRYLPRLPGADTHNTYLRCLCELGIQGIVVFILLILNAVYVLWRVVKRAQQLPRKADRNALALKSYGLMVAIVTLLTAGLTASFIYTEALWWLLAIPVCLERALENATAEAAAAVPTLVGAEAGGGDIHHMTTDIYTDGTYAARNPSWHAEDSPWKAAHLFSLLDSAALDDMRRHGLTVAEIGCGYGGVLASLCRLLGDQGIPCQATGYDIAPAALAELARRHPFIRPVQATLPAEGEFFNLGLMVDILEHLDDPATTLSMACEHFKRVLLHIPLDKNWLGEAKRPGHYYQYLREDRGHIHYYTKTSALALLRSAGLKVVRWKFTPWGTELHQPGGGRSDPVVRVLRAAGMRTWPSLAVRVLGGASLACLCTTEDDANGAPA